MANPLPPKYFTSFDSSTITINVLHTLTTIFSLWREPPRPFTRLRKGSTSSAPSMARSTTGCESRLDRGMPRESVCLWVILEVGIPTMSLSFPWRRSLPMRSTMCLAIELVPRSKTMPDLTYSTAL